MVSRRMSAETIQFIFGGRRADQKRVVAGIGDDARAFALAVARPRSWSEFPWAASGSGAVRKLDGFGVGGHVAALGPDVRGIGAAGLEQPREQRRELLGLAVFHVVDINARLDVVAGLVEARDPALA